MTDTEQLARIAADVAHAREVSERTAQTLADHTAAESKVQARTLATLDQTLGTLQDMQSEGRERGTRQDRAIEMVAHQVQSLGGTVANLDRRLTVVEGAHVGTARQVSEHDVQIAEDKAATDNRLADMHLGIQALTTAFALHVPNRDGSNRPGSGKRTVLQRLSLENRISLLALGLITAALAWKEAAEILHLLH